MSPLRIPCERRLLAIVGRIAAAALLLTTLMVSSHTAKALAAGSTAPWWNSAYSGRINITVSTADAISSGYDFSVTFNHAALVSSGRSLASGNDVRIVRYDGTSTTELDRVLEYGTNNAYYAQSWNSTTTKIWFKDQAAISGSSTDGSYWLYYGNPLAGAPPANPDNVFLLNDNFTGSSLDSSKWNVARQTSGTTISLGSGVLNMSGTSPDGYGDEIVTVATYNGGNITVDADVQINSQPNIYSDKINFGSDTCYVSCIQGTVFTINNQSVGPTAVSGSSSAQHRVSISYIGTSGNTSTRGYEDGVLKGSANGLTGSSYPLPRAALMYSPWSISGPYNVSFDDVVIRPAVLNGPTVSLNESDSTLTASATVDPAFTFAIANQSSACNGESNFVAAAGTATAISLGHLGVNSNASGGQALSVASNAGSGFAVYIRGGQASQNLRSSNHNWNDVSGTYASPAALGSGEVFGFTYKDSTALTNVTNPASANFAALDSTNRAVMGSTSSAVGTGCVSFDAQTSGLTAAGSYIATVIYVAVPSF